MSGFPIPMITLVENRPATTSLIIAECFEKQHFHVIRDIEKLITECPQNFTESNFGLSEYTDSTGRKLPMYHVFFDGFILLVMGYTGPKALKMKLAYIEAFNAMKAKLEANRPGNPTAAITPDMRAALTEIVKSKTAMLDLTPEQRKGWNTQLFRQLTRKFQLSSYTQLPQEKLPEAVEFLLNLEVKPAAGKMKNEDQPTLPADMRINRKLAIENLDKLKTEINTAFKAIEDMVHFGCHPGKSNPLMKPDEKTAYNILTELYAATIDSIQSAQKSLNAGYRLGVMYGRE